MFLALLAPRKRGPNRNIRLEKEVRARREQDLEGEKYRPLIVLPEDENAPVGEWSACFARELGLILRQDAPVRVQNWTAMDKSAKEDLYERAVV